MYGRCMARPPTEGFLKRFVIAQKNNCKRCDNGDKILAKWLERRLRDSQYGLGGIPSS